MAIFCYRDPRNGKIIEKSFECGKAPRRIHIGKIVAERCYAAEFKEQGAVSTRGWPMKSRALGVHPTQVSAFSEFAKRKGVPTTYDTKGNPIFNSPEHKKKYCKIVKAVDYDSYS